MLEITDAAIAWIHSNRSRHRIPAGHGVRLFIHETGSLALRSSPRPDDGERTVNRGGLRFFVGTDAARALAGRCIDVRPSGQADGLVLARRSTAAAA